VQDICLHDDRVEIMTAGGETITAAYVVDAGGYKSILAERFNLRDMRLQAHSRTIFTHMINVPCYHQTSGSQQSYGLPYRMSEGTLHHVFEGGWLWVIPFDNYPESTNPLCSVGLQLDPRLYPLANELSPAEEFFNFIERFPSVAAQLRGQRAVRDWTRTGRIQYSSKQVVGDRWALLGHAAGFIDPLYSKGLYSSLAAVSVTAYLLLQAKKSGDYSAKAFAPLEKMTLNFVNAADRLVANSYKSFGNYKLWQVYAVQWLLGAYTEYVKLNLLRAQHGRNPHAYYHELFNLKLVGGGFADFEPIAGRVDEIIEEVDVHDETAVDRAAAAIRTIFEQLPWLPQPFRALLQGKTYLPRNKIRLELLRRDRGFMGSGAYRDHFFGDMSMVDLLRFGLREKITYAAPLVAWRQRRRFQQKVR
jgi:tetracycline 7-halogenase / FADH2 O2-dependent halogenase